MPKYIYKMEKIAKLNISKINIHEFMYCKKVLEKTVILIKKQIWKSYFFYLSTNPDLKDVTVMKEYC